MTNSTTLTVLPPQAEPLIVGHTFAIDDDSEPVFVDVNQAVEVRDGVLVYDTRCPCDGKCTLYSGEKSGYAYLVVEHKGTCGWLLTAVRGRTVAA